MTEQDQQIGRLLQATENLTEVVRANNARLDKIETALSERRGAERMARWMIGLGGAGGATGLISALHKVWPASS